MLSTQLLQEKAYLFLKEQVVSGQLCVGELYSETQMAKEIGVSRTPFKAALIRLSHEKYIDIIPSKGFQLHVFSEKEIQELFEARIAIESHCALRLMRDRGTPQGREIIGTLGEIVEAMETLGTPSSLMDFLALDSRFHTILVGFLDNDLLSGVYNSYTHQTTLLARESIRLAPPRMREAIQEHREIVTAISQGTMEDCISAVDRHMITSQNISLKTPLMR